MTQMPAPIQGEVWPWGGTKVAAIYRTVGGLPQIVLVCEVCDEIHVVTVQEAMRVALDRWMDRHAKARHAEPVSASENNQDQHSEKPNA